MYDYASPFKIMHCIQLILSSFFSFTLLFEQHCTFILKFLFNYFTSKHLIFKLEHIILNSFAQYIYDFFEFISINELKFII